MPAYVDGFVLPIAKRNIPAYRRMARAAAKIWLEHGALDYRECVGEDLTPGYGVTFPTMALAKKGETVVLAYVTYRSRAHRDRVNAKIMSDPRLQKMMQGKKMPFDVKRMAYGGFATIVGS